jgi:hypothetical protein
VGKGKVSKCALIGDFWPGEAASGAMRIRASYMGLPVSTTVGQQISFLLVTQLVVLYGSLSKLLQDGYM